MTELGVGGAGCAKGPATTGWGMSEEFTEGGTVEGSREAKGPRRTRRTGRRATVNGLGSGSCRRRVNGATRLRNIRGGGKGGGRGADA